MAKIGDKVYIPELDKTGRIKEMNPDGRITKVEIQTPSGPEIIETVNLVVQVFGLIKKLIKLIGGLFRKKKR